MPPYDKESIESNDMSNYRNGMSMPTAESYQGSTTYNDNNVCYLFMTRDELWDMLERNGALQDNEYIKSLKDKRK